MRFPGTTIRPFLAGLLLALFALGITPKVVIHALTVHHKDTHLALDHGKTDQFNKAGFHCTIDNLVVESPFLDHTLSLESGLPACFATKTLPPYKGHLSSSHFIFGLRGPPVTV
ncbi:MAG TPA: hypothetical protein VL832_14905 [Puia sp.]|nr:hypothetical protein [Puia sp.]